MHIGILTGGGDVPGLNACINAVVTQASEKGWQITGLRRGWAGLLHFDPGNDGASRKAHTIKLTPAVTRGLDQTGGTFLHTSRTNPRLIAASDKPSFIPNPRPAKDKAGYYDCTDHIIAMINHLGFDAMIVIGGDGTLNFGAHLHRLGVPVVLIPKTMDNDVYGTDYCIGFSTAVTRGVDAVTALRTTVSSHERIGVISLFGRRSGETALITGYLANADRILISEVAVDIEHLSALITKDRQDNPDHYAMVVVSEGTRLTGDTSTGIDLSKKAIERRAEGIGLRIGKGISDHTGTGIVHQELAYLMRSGTPDALDRMVAKSFGTLAVQQLSENKAGIMTALIDGNYITQPAEICTQGQKHVDVDALFDKAEYRAKIAEVLGKPMFLY